MEGVAERQAMEGKGPSPPSAVTATVLEDDANNSGAIGRNYGEREAEENERRSLELKAGLHPLQHKFVFWYTRRTGVRSQTSYEDNIKKIMDFSTDSANCNGGKWIIRFNKAVSGRFWEDLVLALVGDQLDGGEDICGVVLSIRFGEDILSVWNRNAADHQAVMALRDAIKRQLKLPPSYLMEYKAHDASLKDNSSYRNTWLRG
ncbi:Eukaryotic translation initiation factor [Nymphaea thermarum]|nr:Eukaryotic translation initiation factor [Nymphaea thermarum]